MKSKPSILFLALLISLSGYSFAFAQEDLKIGENVQPSDTRDASSGLLTAAQEEGDKRTPVKALSGDSENTQEKQPIIINADTIEYSKEKNVVTLEGNVKLIKENSVLTCDKATVNTATNEAHAQGHVILEDGQGVIKANSCDYNFKTKTGQAFDATIAYHPYFGSGKIVRKVSENEIEIKNGYFTTCDKEQSPHYRIQSRLLRLFPNDKVTAKAMTMRVANTPIFYMPKFTQNLKDDRMHVEVSPGKNKDWGLFLLTAWRYDLLPDSGGRVHLDYREKKDFAWGIDNYYDTKKAGKGYVKTYYMNERTIGRKHLYSYPVNLKATSDTQRYRIQWRHKWDIDKNTYWLAEYHKLSDTKFIKDYFFREYEKDKQPLSYLVYNRILSNQSSTLSILTQKRTNRIFSETEKLPEIKLDNATTQILESPFYVSSNVSYVSFNEKIATTPENAGRWDEDDASQREDLYKRFSLPFKLAFLELNPFAGSRETYFRRISGRDVGVFREVWDSGISLTTRFYRIFDVDTDIVGMEISKLRHIVSPNINYSYIHPPTVSSTKLLQFDGIDAIGESNQIAFSLENKLQTKRRNKTVDFLRLIVDSNYFFNVEGRNRNWSDTINFDLEMLPYDWMRFESDATYNHEKDYFSYANFDATASGKGLSVGGGYRYERKSSSQMTGEIICNLIKGWSFKVYERLQFKGNSLLKEQTYSISKELHCWILDVNYNVVRERGETIWFALRLKAFPEMSIDYNQNYHDPKPMSQGYAEGKAAD